MSSVCEGTDKKREGWVTDILKIHYFYFTSLNLGSAFAANLVPVKYRNLKCTNWRFSDEI